MKIKITKLWIRGLIPLGLVFAIGLLFHIKAQSPTAIVDKALEKATENEIISEADHYPSKTLTTLPKVIKQEVQRKQESESPFRFDIVFIFDALSQVHVDDDDNVIVDHRTKELLESSFMQMTTDLSAEELEELQALIKLGIHGRGGQQAAKIVIDYYHYRIAENTFVANAHSSDIADVKTNFEQIKAIRRAELGYDVAERLYGMEELHSRYMIESMQIQENKRLSQEEKNQAQNTLTIAFEEASKKYK